jgi:hypothetical protein
MDDMLGKPVKVGDYFLLAVGNPRYGGIVASVGKVVGSTEKMWTCARIIDMRKDTLKLKVSNCKAKKFLVVPSTVIDQWPEAKKLLDSKDLKV